MDNLHNAIKKTRRWRSYSVRGLLVLLTLCTLAMGVFTIYVRQHIKAYQLEQETLQSIQQSYGSIQVGLQERGPDYLRWFDKKYNQRVTRLRIESREFVSEDIEKLLHFPFLYDVAITSEQGIKDTDLAKLASLADLRNLFLATKVHHSGRHVST